MFIEYLTVYLKCSKRFVLRGLSVAQRTDAVAIDDSVLRAYSVIIVDDLMPRYYSFGRRV